MPNVIHYEDDIFLVDSMVRMVENASHLDADGIIVGDAIINIIRLADNTLTKIKNMVITSEHLVERAEYLRLLSITSRGLKNAIDNFLFQRSSLFEAMAVHDDELRRIAMAQEQTNIELGNSIEVSLQNESSREDIVSGDEISELLGPL